jgi:hypothetical protein
MYNSSISTWNFFLFKTHEHEEMDEYLRNLHTLEANQQKESVRSMIIERENKLLPQRASLPWHCFLHAFPPEPKTTRKLWHMSSQFQHKIQLVMQ